MMSAAGEVDIVNRPYREVRAALLAFRNANRNQPRDLRYFDWRYCGRPSGREPIVVHAEDARGRMIGAMSLIPHHFSVDGDTRLVGILGDISVAEQWRGKGIADRMLSHLAGLDPVRELAASVVLPNPAAGKMLGRSGWHGITELRRHVAFLPGAGRGPDGRAPAARTLDRALGWAISLRPRAGLRVEGNFEAALVEGFDAAFDDLWREARMSFPLVGFRNRDYLAWRYADHPFRSYSILALRQRERLWGYVVYFQEKGRCHVDDFLCRDGFRGAERCLRIFVDYARARRLGSAIVAAVPRHVLSSGGRYRTGLLLRPSAQKCMIFAGDGPESCPERWAAERWFLTAGDKDS